LEAGQVFASSLFEGLDVTSDAVAGGQIADALQLLVEADLVKALQHFRRKLGDGVPVGHAGGEEGPDGQEENGGYQRPESDERAMILAAGVDTGAIGGGKGAALGPTELIGQGKQNQQKTGDDEGVHMSGVLSWP